MADWCVAVTSGLTDDQFQHMLGDAGTMGEFGGPHEVLADVYAITGDRKYLTLAERFKHRVIFDPLARGDASILTGQHANTEIPKFVGYERIYQLTGDKSYDAARTSGRMSRPTAPGPTAATASGSTSSPPPSPRARCRKSAARRPATPTTC